MVDAATGSASIPVKIKAPELEAKLNFHPGDQPLTFQLLDGDGNPVATANGSNGKRIRTSGLAPGNYTYWLSGSLSKSVDYVVSGCQEH
jgi:hypothetical protein